jgi:hypothetical protein
MDVETLIRAANPVTTRDLPAADSPGARRTLEEILRPPASARPRPAGRRSAQRLALVGVAAAAAVAVLVTALLPGPPGRPGRVGSNAGSAPNARSVSPGTALSAFQRLALVADAQTAATPLGPGQYLYTESRALGTLCAGDGAGYCVSYQEYRQVWIAANGSGRTLQTDDHPTWPTPRDRAHWIALGRPSLRVAPQDARYGPGGLNIGPGARSAWKLPTNPAKLAALISGRKIEGGPPGPAEDFVQVADLLREADVTPAVRSALFQVAAHLPGVRVLGPARGYPAKTSIRIGYSSPVPQPVAGFGGGIKKYQLIFDKHTSALLAERYVYINPRTGRPSPQSFQDYLATGVVGSITATAPSRGAS